MITLRPEIVVRLHHGLCNQMFQYAFGRDLARRLGVPVRFDRRELLAGRWPDRPYGLGAFALTLDDADPARVDWLREDPVGRRWNRAACGLVARALAVVGPSYFNGYWQDWRLVEPNRAELMRAFVFRDAPGPEAAALLGELAAQEAPVGVHVRRGDFVSSRLDVCRPDYFRAAVAWMRHHVSGATFLVASDDVAWAERELAGLGPGLMFIPAAVSGLDTLRLLARCRHHVLANSSFSWWAAWLARAPGQRVVLPDIAFSDRPAAWQRWTWAMPDWIALPAG